MVSRLNRWGKTIGLHRTANGVDISDGILAASVLEHSLEIQGKGQEPGWQGKSKDQKPISKPEQFQGYCGKTWLSIKGSHSQLREPGKRLCSYVHSALSVIVDTKCGFLHDDHYKYI